MRASRPVKVLRGFRIFDALVAIAALAVGLGWARDDWGWIQEFAPPRSGWADLLARRSTAYQWTRSTASSTIYVASALVSPWCLALVAIRRSRVSRLPFWRVRKPGALACLASSSVLSLLLAAQAVRPYRDLIHLDVGRRGEFRLIWSGIGVPWDRPGDLDPFLNTLLQAPRLTGFVVAGAWLALAMAGRWRPDPGWIDRLGRAIGVFWIIEAVYFLIFPL